MTRRTRAPMAALVTLLVAGALTVFTQSRPALAADTATINGSTVDQVITGFGASEGFGQAATIMNLPSAAQTQALNFLYGPTSGAGLNILRNEISADSGDTIEPTAPSSPTATPAYVSLASINQDMGQLWLAQQIKSLYGVTNDFADVWSPPGFMKTNGSAINGGTLCGVPNATCSSGDWRQAFANYMVQYAKDYAAADVPLSSVGPENEANLGPSYDGDLLTPAQTANFLDVLGPTVASSGLSTKINCCATEGWNFAQQYAAAIEADPTALADTATFTSHGYTQAPTTPLSGWTKPVWETEWSTFETWDPAWDDGTAASGLTWAQHIFQGLDGSNLNAFLYWWASSTPSGNGDNESLIQINGSTVSPSGRLWAFANWSRYVHPGAVRIGATASNGNLTLDAFKNPDGSVSIVTLNTATSADAVTYSLSGTGVANGATVTPWLTNSTSNAAATATTTVAGGAFTATIPARSLVTYTIPAGSGGTPPPTSPPPTTPPPTTPPPTSPPPTSPAPSSGCHVTYTTASQWAGGFVANVTIQNTGTTPITGWTLTFTFPGDQKITNGWNGTPSQSGENVTVTNASYNATIAAGGSASLGFQGTWTSSDAAPTSFAVNGTACT